MKIKSTFVLVALFLTMACCITTATNASPDHKETVTTECYENFTLEQITEATTFLLNAQQSNSTAEENVYCYGRVWDDTDPNNPVWRRVYVYTNGSMALGTATWCHYCAEPQEPQGIPCDEV